LVAAVGVTIAPWAQPRRRGGKLAGVKVAQLLTQLHGGGDQQRPQRISGLGAGLHRRGSGHPQAPHHLDHAVTGLGDSGRLAGQHRSGSGLGIDRVRLAPPAAALAVRPVDLNHHLPLRA
jgi:hypothetical protein